MSEVASAPVASPHAPAPRPQRLRDSWPSDLLAGFLVFLVALPLCIGISMASGFPPFSGIITAVVGGLLVTPLMSGQLSIKGPAAGLIVIALGAATELGAGDPSRGYRQALACIVAAGLLQALFGALKLGRYADAAPASVVHGMLAAIGVLIAAKQAHVALGVKPEAKEALGLISEIPRSVLHANPGVALIALASLVVLFGWPWVQRRAPNMAKVPAPVLVVGLAVPASYLLDLEHPHHYAGIAPFGPFDLGPSALVAVPESLLRVITTPDFSGFFSAVHLKYVAMFALVGSIESVLSAKAVDQLDPWHRRTDLDRDLLAVGLGNVVAGMLGGLPMITEIVRSSANVQNGARSRAANFFHGAFLLGFVALAPGLVHHIPLAALAAMLLYTGYRLASPAEFARTAQLGMGQLSVFVATVVATVATDLLVGVAAGVALKLALHVARGASPQKLLRADLALVDDGERVTVSVRGPLAFTNFLAARRTIAEALAQRASVRVDLSQATLVDHTVLEGLHDLERQASHSSRMLELTGLDELSGETPHPKAARFARREVAS